MTSTHLSPDEARVDVARDVTLFAIQHEATGLPGNGGLRVLAYPDDAAALADARVLAARMTRKHRLYATGFGGFKLVARCDPADPAARRALLAAVAEVLNDRRGALYTGCDLNTDAADMAHLTGLTPYVLAAVGSPVDASAATAWGVVGSLGGVAWLPDALSSAGAVLCDSIEHYNPARFRGVDPNAVYAYVHATIAARTAAFVAARAAEPAAEPDDLLAALTAADDGRICGLEFTRWQESL